MKKYNKSEIMKTMWKLVKEENLSKSDALKRAWAEAKKEEKSLLDTLKENIADMMYNDYHINAGVERRVNSKLWEKDGKSRMYLSIACYTLNGKFKGQYKAGYVDMVANEYVCGRYDQIDALNKVCQ